MKRNSKKTRCQKCHHRNTRTYRGKPQFDLKYPDQRAYMFMTVTTTCMDCNHKDTSHPLPFLLEKVFSIKRLTREGK